MIQTAHTFEHTIKKKKPVKPYITGCYGNLMWYLQEEFTLFHLILKTSKSLIINDITSFLL